MKKAYIRGIFAIGLVSLVLTGCGAKEPLSRGETIVARVGKEKITLAQVDSLSEGAIVYAKALVGDDFENGINEILESSSDENKISEYENQKSIIIDTRKRVLEGVVESKLFALEAREKKLISDGILEENPELIKMFYNSSGSELSEEEVQELFENKINNMVNNYGIPREVAIKEYEDALGEKLLKDEMKKEVSVSSEEIEEYYNENIDSYVIDGTSKRSLQEVSEEIERTLFYEEYSELIDAEVERLSKKHKVVTFEEELNF